ncbi:unnamed protein product [Boreogadus saida]
MANSVVVHHVPPSPPELTGWSTELLDCCDDMNSCCYAFWCWPCFACTTTKKFGERRCLPLLDILTPAVAAAVGIPLCVPPAGLALRVAIRHRYGIKGTLCKDIMASCFCGWCSWCQLAREMKLRNRVPGVCHGPAQAGVVNMQPPPSTLTSPQVQLVHQPSFIAPSHGYGPVVPAPGPVAPVYFTTWTAETCPTSAPAGGAYALPGYPFQSDFL